jgi:uncharacterized OB-fold protein
MQTRLIADGVFTPAPAPQLFGGRHLETGRIVFPCPKGVEAPLFEVIALPRKGTLWSWTVQRFRPKSPPYAGPEDFEPFALGYVALPGHVIVESRLTGIAFDALQIGMALRLTTVPFSTDADGTVVLTYAFEPVGEPA